MILKMEGTIIGILTFVIIFLIAFGIIKLIFKPIKTSTALLLTLPAISTCGIALLIYKFLKMHHMEQVEHLIFIQVKTILELCLQILN